MVLFASLSSFDISAFMHKTVIGQVAFSKIGFLILVSILYKLYSIYQVHERLLAAAIRAKSSLPASIQDAIILYFKEQHNLTIELSDSEGCVAGIQSFKYKNKMFIFMPAQERAIFTEGPSYGISEENIFAIFDHEACHLTSSHIVLRNIGALLIEPCGLVAGKLASLYGMSLENSILVGFSVYWALVILKQKCISQYQEKQSDLVAATTPEKCRALAKYFEVRYLPLDNAATPYQILRYRLLGDHPLNAIRIKYLEERAQKLEKLKVSA